MSLWEKGEGKIPKREDTDILTDTFLWYDTPIFPILLQAIKYSSSSVFNNGFQ